MTKPFQEKLNDQFMSKPCVTQDIPCEITKHIKLNTKSSYNVIHDHNYSLNHNKRKFRWPDEKEYSNYTELITNDYDKCDSIPDWIMVKSSSDEEDDINDIPLSQILKTELDKDLLHEYKNKKCASNLLPFNEDQIYNELTNTNHHDLSNVSNDSNNIISENYALNYKTQSIEFHTKLFTLPCKKNIVKKNYMCNKLLSKTPMRKKTKKDSYNNNLLNGLMLQNDLMSSSLNLNNSLFMRKTRSSNKSDNFPRTNPSAINVCPPLQWIHLIYLAIKNSVTENVTCFDIQRLVRYWFPYYCKRSYIKFIRVILSHINRYYQKYFYCNSFPIMTDQDDTWTINSLYISTMEQNLMNTVENNEDKIKSAMTNPDQLSMILNGYGVHYLGHSQNFIKNK